jgi:hypothetical protein
MTLSVAFALASLIGAPTPPAPSPAARPEELVRLLGDKSYRVREVAARELIRRGSASVAALTAAVKDPDPEVSERARQLLPQAAAVERNEKLALLLKDPSAPPPKGLAGLDRFLKATGDSKEARELYVEMMGIHHRTIETAETNPKEAAEQLSLMCAEAYQKWQVGARTGRYSYDNVFSGRSDITFFLFLASDTRLRQHDQGLNYSYVFFSGNQMSKAIADKDGSPAMRKLFLDWLEREPQSYLQQRGFTLAAQSGIKEALPILIRMLEKKDRDPYGKSQVMVSLIKLGNKEHIKLLDPYLKDDTQVTTINFGNGPQLSVQVRDVAMGVQVQLAGQKLTDYGFDNRFGGGGLSYHYYGFPDDADGKSKARTDAHAKWAEWTKKNLANPAAGAPVERGPKPTEKK